MCFDHDSSQEMKIVYMQSHCSVALLNETLKPDMHLLKQLQVLNMRSNYLALQVTN
jgi:hypothetical protein